MRRSLIWIMVGTLGWAGIALAERMSVQVQDGQVRKTPSFLGAVVVKLPYGTAVDAQPAQNGWVQVKTADGQQGWIHESALTKKKIVLASGGTTTAQASSDELALAGKGFNSDVEKQFKKQNPNLNFGAVDHMLKIKVTPREMQKFLDDGNVKPAGGAK